MYVELCMEFGKTEINFQQSSNLQGVIMENISTGMREFFMEISLIRIVNMCQKRRERCSLAYKDCSRDEAYKNIILPMSGAERDYTKKTRNYNCSSRKKTTQMMEAKTLLDEFYDKKCSRYFEVYFLTPTAFKHDGNYIFIRI